MNRLIYELNIFIMRLLSLLLLSIFYSGFSLFSQHILTKDILVFSSEDRNSKTVLFSSQNDLELEKTVSFLLKAENESSKEFSKCVWNSVLSLDQINNFINALSMASPTSYFENALFSVKYKNSKLIKISFKETKCVSEHKIYYFQKPCNRSLSFTLHTESLSYIINALESAMNHNKFVKN